MSLLRQAGTTISFTLPLASPAKVLSVTGSSGTNWTANCDMPGCGFAGGESVDISSGVGNNFPSGCQGISAINSVSANTAAVTNTTGTTCPNGVGPFSNVFGSTNNLFSYVNSSWPSGQGFGCFESIDNDAHLNRFCTDNNSTGIVQLNLDPGIASVGLFNTVAAHQGALYLDKNGNTCVGDTTINSAGCASTAFTADNNTHFPGLVVKYAGVSTQSPASLGGVSNSSNPNDGIPVFVWQFKPTATFSGNLGTTTIFTTPSTGYGANTGYRLRGQLICATNCSTGTAYVSATYSDLVSGASTFTTCPSTGGAGNMYAVCNATPTTPWGFTNSSKLPFDFNLGFVASSSNIQIAITTTNSPTYYLMATLSIE